MFHDRLLTWLEVLFLETRLDILKGKLNFKMPVWRVRMFVSVSPSSRLWNLHMISHFCFCIFKMYVERFLFQVYSWGNEFREGEWLVWSHTAYSGMNWDLSPGFLVPEVVLFPKQRVKVWLVAGKWASHLIPLYGGVGQDKDEARDWSGFHRWLFHRRL